MGFVMSQSFGAFHLFVTSPSSSSSSSSGETETETETAEIVTAFVTSGVGLTALLALLVLLLVFTLALGFRTSTPPESSNSPAPVPSGKLTPASGVTTEALPHVENLVILGNPMALPGGSCSAVISARCHFVSNMNSDGKEKGKTRRRSVVFSGVPDDYAASGGADTTEIWKRPLVWGVVGEGGGGAGHIDESTAAAAAAAAAAVGTGHCGFTVAGRAGVVTEGRAYA